jgi:DNA-binding MarR family transcriptional regulator
MDSDDLARAVRSFVAAFGLDLVTETPCGVPVSVSEAFALDALQDGPLRQQELATRLHLTKSTVSRLLDDMTDKRLVRRRADPSDGRAVSIELLSLGRKRAEQLRTARNTKYSALLEAIPAAERHHVIEAVRVLAAAAQHASGKTS